MDSVEHGTDEGVSGGANRNLITEGQQCFLCHASFPLVIERVVIMTGNYTK